MCECVLAETGPTLPCSTEQRNLTVLRARGRRARADAVAPPPSSARNPPNPVGSTPPLHRRSTLEKRVAKKTQGKRFIDPWELVVHGWGGGLSPGGRCQRRGVGGAAGEPQDGGPVLEPDLLQRLRKRGIGAEGGQGHRGSLGGKLCGLLIGTHNSACFIRQEPKIDHIAGGGEIGGCVENLLSGWEEGGSDPPMDAQKLCTHLTLRRNLHQV